MPTYSYECAGCGSVVDVFHGMSAEPRVKCESCGKKCRRLMGTGGGFIFKGSGFYETDYKDKKGTAPAKEGASGDNAKADAPAKTEGTSGTAADTKSSSGKGQSGEKKKAANN